MGRSQIETEEIAVEEVAEVEVESPVLIEGLPGVGHVGKLVSDHIVGEFESEVVRRIYSQHFPPQSEVDDEGMAELVSKELHHCEVEGNDFLVLTGDHQSQTMDGHYKVTGRVLDIAEEFGVERVYTLGGVPTGELVEEYDVYGAANDRDFLEETKELGVDFESDEPAGGIVGISGLLLGLGEQRGVPAVCLMGETSGYMVDPKSAQAVLEVLTQALGFEVDMEELEERAEEMEEVVQRLQDMNQIQQSPSAAGENDLRYIG